MNEGQETREERVGGGDVASWLGLIVRVSLRHLRYLVYLTIYILITFWIWRILVEYGRVS